MNKLDERLAMHIGSNIIQMMAMSVQLEEVTAELEALKETQKKVTPIVPKDKSA